MFVFLKKIAENFALKSPRAAQPSNSNRDRLPKQNFSPDIVRKSTFFAYASHLGGQ